jgi:hypothetical protein
VHPLDTFSLDGFRMVASSDVVVRRSLDDVWRLLAVENDEADLAAGLIHRVIERFGPGEHRCSMIGSVDGRSICTRGFRRLLAHSEVLEVQSFPSEDHIVRISYTPLRRGRTRISTDAGLRPTRTTYVSTTLLASSPTSWIATVQARQEHDLRYLRAH